MNSIITFLLGVVYLVVIWFNLYCGFTDLQAKKYGVAAVDFTIFIFATICFTSFVNNFISW